MLQFANMNKLLLRLALAIIVAVCCGIAVAQVQEPESGPAAWIVKLTTAIKNGSEATLTADEAKALVTAYAALEQRQVADLAVSETHVYVLGPSGVVLLSKLLP